MKLEKLLEFIGNIDNINDQALDILLDDDISDRQKIVFVTMSLVDIRNAVAKVDTLDKIQ